MNIKLLNKVKEAIKQEPKRLMMGDWLWVAPYRMAAGPRCGTTGCIAGWALTLNTGIKQMRRAAKNVFDSPMHIWEDSGRKVLRLTAKQADRLFYLSDWPEEMCKRYVQADSAAKRVKITIERIDQFIASKGKI